MLRQQQKVAIIMVRVRAYNHNRGKSSWRIISQQIENTWTVKSHLRIAILTNDSVFAKRSFFNVRKAFDDVTSSKSTRVESINTKKDSVDLQRHEQGKEASTTSSKRDENVTASTPLKNKIWQHTKNVAVWSYTTILGISKSSLTWFGHKLSSSLRDTMLKLRERSAVLFYSYFERVSDALGTYKNQIRDKVYDGSRTFITSILSPFKAMFNTICELWRTTPIWNRFFWWSLSAIGVYGIATTLPKEIIKLAIESTGSTTAKTDTATSAKASMNDERTVQKYADQVDNNFAPEN